VQLCSGILIMIHSQTSGFYCYWTDENVHFVHTHIYTTYLIRKLISCRIVRDFLIICNTSPTKARSMAAVGDLTRRLSDTIWLCQSLISATTGAVPPETNLIWNFRTSSNLKRLALSFSLLFFPRSLHKVCYFSLACCENILLWCVYGTHSTQR